MPYCARGVLAKRRRARQACVLGLASTALALFVSSCFDFGSLSNDATDAASTQADGTFDIDGGSPTDASREAQTDASGFCAQNPGHTICDDFDDDAWRAPWNGPDDLNAVGSIGRDPSLFLSPPYGLAAAVAPDGGPGYAFLQTELGVIPSSLHIELDFYLIEGGQSSMSLATVKLPNSFSFTVRLAQPSPPLFQVVELSSADGGIRYDTLPGPIAPVSTGRWYHVDMTFDLLGADAGEVDISFDHATAVTSLVPRPFSFNAGDTLQLQAGMASFSSTPFFPAAVRIDNLVVDAK